MLSFFSLLHPILSFLPSFLPSFLQSTSSFCLFLFAPFPFFHFLRPIPLCSFILSIPAVIFSLCLILLFHHFYFPPSLALFVFCAPVRPSLSYLANHSSLTSSFFFSLHTLSSLLCFFLLPLYFPSLLFSFISYFSSLFNSFSSYYFFPSIPSLSSSFIPSSFLFLIVFFPSFLL